MSIISGVKHAPRKGSSFKKSEQLPQFGIKIDKEPELASVSIYIIINVSSRAILEDCGTIWVCDSSLEPHRPQTLALTHRTPAVGENVFFTT